MSCPSCQAENHEAAEVCFTCGERLIASPTSITRGTVLTSRYEILGPLGKGGMGTVYKAHDRTLDETVALKVMRSDLVRQQDLIRRFRSEIKLARKVRHPNVCAIHEYSEDAGLHFIVMEFVDGTDLRRFLREGGRLTRLPPPPGARPAAPARCERVVIEEIVVDCPYCGEHVALDVDTTDGAEQSYFEDCPVCCRPMEGFVRSRPGEVLSISVSAD